MSGIRLPALALAVRALRLDARSLPRMWLRVASIAGLLVALLWAVESSSLFGAPGLRFFSWLAHMDLWLVSLLGVATFSGVITEEKEAMTMGLLKLAGFGRASILLGKSVAQLTGACVLLLVQLPFAVLALTMGGVSRAQILSVFALLLAYLLLVYGIALLASTVCRTSRAAARLTVFVLLVLLLGPSIGSSLLTWLCGPPVEGASAWIHERLAEIEAHNPWAALSRIVQGGYDADLLSDALLGSLLGSALAIGCAWLVFERCNRDEWRPAPERGWIGLRRGRRTNARPAPGPAALAWKDFHFLGGGRVGVWTRIIVFPLGIALLWEQYESRWPTGARGELFAIMLLPWLLCICALELCIVASRVLHEEVKWKTLPALVALPFGLRAIVWAKVRGYALMLVPIVMLVASDLLLIVVDHPHHAGDFMWLAALYFGSVLAFATMFAAYMSLLVRRGALAITIAAIVVAHMLTGVMLALSSGGGAGSFEASVVVLSLVYLGVAAACYAAIFPRLRLHGGR